MCQLGTKFSNQLKYFFSNSLIVIALCEWYQLLVIYESLYLYFVIEDFELIENIRKVKLLFYKILYGMLLNCSRFLIIQILDLRENKKTANCLNKLFFVSFCFPESFKMHIGRSSDSSWFLKPSRKMISGNFLKTFIKIYSSGHCSWISHDSLLILW